MFKNSAGKLKWNTQKNDLKQGSWRKAKQRETEGQNGKQITNERLKFKHINSHIKCTWWSKYNN